MKRPTKAETRGFRLFITVLAAIGVVALGTPPTASGSNRGLSFQTRPVDTAVQLDTFFRQLTTRDAFSGAVFISRDQQVLLRAGYGLADREWNIPNTPLTKFRIASITKGFTAAAIMLLAEQGKLNVQDPICHYVDQCPVAWQSITLHELLTHTSGIADYDNMLHYDTFKLNPATPNQIVDFFRNEPLRFSPGTSWDYSNSGYILLGQVIRKLSNTSYADFLQHHFFTPLGLTNTGIEDMTALVPQRARGYQSPTKLAAYIDMTTEDAAGEIYSTVDDLYHWNQALVGGKVVMPKTFDAMLQAGVPLPADRPPFASKYAYGFITGEYQGHVLYFQAGDVSGFLSFMFYFPSDKTTIIILSNLASLDFGQIIAGPLSILYGS